MTNRYDPYDDIPDADVIDISSPRRKTLTEWLAQPSGLSEHTLMAETRYYLLQDRCRALQAKTVLEHTAGLSMMKQQIDALAPESSAYTKAILEAYVRRAGEQLLR